MFPQRLSLGLLVLCAVACLRLEPQSGNVLVRAPNAGVYEIYRIESEEPLQFVSEQIGRFNEPLSLAPGQYLILADCSNETVVVRPGEDLTLVAHQVLFNPPVPPQADDSFSIQCNRFAKTKSRQHILNRFSLNILPGPRDLLVGMVPLRVEFDPAAATEPQVVSYQLSGLRVEAFEGMKPKTSFFVSPTEGLLSITENQVFGRWQFLLPGTYRVEVNGTRMEVTLAEGQQFTMSPAFLRVSVSDAVNLQASSSILGTPLYVELNGGHWLDLDETYPVLPGEASLKLNGSLYAHKILLEEGQLTEKKVRSVLVDLNCAPWDWACLGSREIFLYQTDKPYPFAEGMTDVPLLFFEEDAWVSIQGSRDLRYKIPDNVLDSDLKVGFAKLTPKQHYRAGQVTDLSRIEAPGLPLAGHSLDLPIDGETLMPLIVGRYLLAQYQALATSDWERRAQRQAFQVQAKEVVEITYPIYVTERQYRSIREQQLKEDQERRERKFRLSQWRFRPVIPVRIE